MKHLAHNPEVFQDELESLRKSQQLHRLILDNIHDLIAIHRLADLSYIYVNPATLQVLGYTREELFAQSAFELIHPEDMSRVVARFKARLPAGESQDEFRYRTKDGSYVWLEVRGALMPCEGDDTWLIIISRDITAQKQTQAALCSQAEVQPVPLTAPGRRHRNLAVTRAVKMAAAQAKNEDDLLHEVCRQIVEAGGHSLAWVGYVQPDPQQKVKPVAYAGLNNAYLAKLNIYIHDPKRGRGPVGTAIRTGQRVVTTDFKNNEAFKPWAKDALRRGFKSCMAIPLLEEDHAFGALSIYSREIDTFDAEEQEFLQELADILVPTLISLRSGAAFH